MKDWTKKNDPQGSGNSRGKNREQRKHRNDPGFTPTESHIKDGLMRQFMKNKEGAGGNSEAYKTASCWDENGRLKP